MKKENRKIYQISLGKQCLITFCGHTSENDQEVVTKDKARFRVTSACFFNPNTNEAPKLTQEEVFIESRINLSC